MGPGFSILEDACRFGYLVADFYSIAGISQIQSHTPPPKHFYYSIITIFVNSTVYLFSHGFQMCLDLRLICLILFIIIIILFFILCFKG